MFLYLLMPRNFEEISSHRLFYANSYHTIKALGRVLLGLRVSGQENVPEEGAALVVADHHDLLDIFVLPVAIPRRHISMVAKQEIFDYPIFGRFFSMWDGIRFNRDIFDRAAYEEIKRRIDNDRLVGLFPGGTRTTGPGIGDFDPATAGYAMYTEAPTIPAAISGVEESFTRGHRWSAHVDFGPAIDPPANKKDQARYMRELTGSVQSLSRRNVR